MFEYSQADLDAQMAALPMMIQIWLNWMLVVIIFMPLIFFRRKQGRIAIVTSLLLITAAVPISLMYGMTNLVAAVHLVLWVPLVLYFCQQLRVKAIPMKSFFGIWSVVMVASCIISLAFDVRDFSYWIMGDRGIFTASSSFDVPWLVLSFMTLALLGAASYVFRWWPKA